MKRINLIIWLLVTFFISFSQTVKVDTNYATRAVSAVWMPDGGSLLIAVVKYHKTDQQAPFFSKVFNYDLGSKQLTYLFDNGGNLAPSPDGKTIAFLKRDDNKRTDIYFFNTITKKETVLKTDTSRKNSLEWSPDGKNLLYNISHGGTGQHATIDICVLNIATKHIKQITQSGKDKSYDPNWCPDSKKIVYYLEKGDGHDQIWLTDINGSFHTNLTNDYTTHNYFASWFDEQTIVYTQSPETIMLMNVNDRKKTKVEGINSEQVKYNSAVGKFVYIINAETENNVILYDWKKKTQTIIPDGIKMIDKY
jgi:Tol biopolymer transport system component